MVPNSHLCSEVELIVPCVFFVVCVFFVGVVVVVVLSSFLGGSGVLASLVDEGLVVACGTWFLGLTAWPLLPSEDKLRSIQAAGHYSTSVLVVERLGYLLGRLLHSQAAPGLDSGNPFPEANNHVRRQREHAGRAAQCHRRVGWER